MESATKLKTMVKKRKRAKTLGDVHRWVAINYDDEKTHPKRSLMAMRIKKVEIPNQVKLRGRFKTNKSSLKFHLFLAKVTGELR